MNKLEVLEVGPLVSPTVDSRITTVDSRITHIE
jgi:hypothetical protein